MRREKEREKDKIYIYIYIYCVRNKWALALCFFLSTKQTTVLPICQDDNLVGGRIDDLLKVAIALSK